MKIHIVQGSLKRMAIVERCMTVSLPSPHRLPCLEFCSIMAITELTGNAHRGGKISLPRNILPLTLITSECLAVHCILVLLLYAVGCLPSLSLLSATVIPSLLSFNPLPFAIGVHLSIFECVWVYFGRAPVTRYEKRAV